MTDYFNGHHFDQYDWSPTTARYGCTWTTGATGIATVTRNASAATPDTVHSHLATSEQTDPSNPGWSLADLGKALGRMGVGFEDRSGRGWPGVENALADGLYVVLQGVSAKFPAGTCSAAFKGPHAVGVNPDARLAGTARVPQQWLDDPICPDGRWEDDDVLRRFAQAFRASVNFGVLTTPVPLAAAVPVNPAPGTSEANVTIRYSAVTDTKSTMHLARGQRCYASPGGRAVTAMTKEGDVPHIGLAASVNGVGWRAVLIGTGTPYADKRPRPTVLYVPASAGEVTAR